MGLKQPKLSAVSKESLLSRIHAAENYHCRCVGLFHVFDCTCAK